MDTVSNRQSKKNKPSSDNSMGVDSVPSIQDDYLKLLLSKERQIEGLEQDKVDLIAQHEKLQSRFDAQSEIIEALKASGNVVRMPVNRRAIEGGARRIQLNDLTELDQSEFQSIEAIPQESVIKKTGHSTLNGLRNIGSLTAASGGWLAKKVFAILT